MLWAQIRKAIVKGLWNVASTLEGQSTTEVPQETILEVAKAVTAAEREGVKVEWIDRKISEIVRPRNRHQLAQYADQLREQVVVLQQQLNEVAGEMELLESEMSWHRLEPASPGKYIVHFFQ